WTPIWPTRSRAHPSTPGRFRPRRDARLGLGPLDWVSACSTASCGWIHHDLVLDFEVDPPAGDISGLGRLCPSGGGPAGQRRSISTKTTSSVPSGFEISCSAPAARV